MNAKLMVDCILSEKLSISSDKLNITSDFRTIHYNKTLYE